MSTWIEATPAYGRDYKNQAAVKADWKANKDFCDTTSGRYVNASDAAKYGLKVVVRYARGAKLVQVN